MKNKEQLLNKENWLQYLNLADDGGLTNNAKANDIVSKIKQGLTLPIDSVSKRCFCGAEFDGIECDRCGFDASEVDIY